MPTTKPTWHWMMDVCIAVLFLGLLWRLYLPLTEPSAQAVQFIETEPITIEHIIRELHVHADSLSVDQRQRLLKELEYAEVERDRLLNLIKTAHEIDQQLSQMAIQIWATLSPEERLSVRNDRNAISVEQIEKVYWKQTKERLEKE
ncbi:MAG: hypothetical protein VX026_10045 [Myxococcota bacterium]|nr:hypothetical protein [Myxococcota bacterium]